MDTDMDTDMDMCMDTDTLLGHGYWTKDNKQLC